MPLRTTHGRCVAALALLFLPSLESFPRCAPRRSLRLPVLKNSDVDGDLTPEELEGLNRGRPKINWYPGHIAKAERQLMEYLSCVDVVIEVRDSRIPFSTTHPLVPQWVGAKPHVIVFNRRDCAPAMAIAEWRRHFVEEIKTQQLRQGRQPGVDLVETPVFSFNAKSSATVHEIRKSCLRLGAHVNDKRRTKGLLPRAIRIAVIGFPNVGKSALINRLIGRKMAKSADTPGVTRQLTWIRLGKDRDGADIELLDSPGIIPAKQVDQNAAEALAMCNDIGSASYEPEHIAVALIERMVLVAEQTEGDYVDMKQVVSRCDGFDPFTYCGEGGRTPDEFVHRLADMRHRGDVYGASTRLLNDFRKGMLGLATLEAPPARRRQYRERRDGPAVPKADAAQPEKRGEIDFDLNTFGVGNFEGW